MHTPPNTEVDRSYGSIIATNSGSRSHSARSSANDVELEYVHNIRNEFDRDAGGTLTIAAPNSAVTQKTDEIESKLTKPVSKSSRTLATR